MEAFVVPRPPLGAQPVMEPSRSPTADSAPRRPSAPQLPRHPGDSPAPEAGSTPSATAAPRDRLAVLATDAPVPAPPPAVASRTGPTIFRCRTSLMAACSSARSAYIRLSLACSASSSRSCRTSDTDAPPYLLRHLKNVALLTPCVRHRSGTGTPLSASRRMPTIWVSLNLDFRMTAPWTRAVYVQLSIDRGSLRELLLLYPGTEVAGQQGRGVSDYPPGSGRNQHFSLECGRSQTPRVHRNVLFRPGDRAHLISLYQHPSDDPEPYALARYRRKFRGRFLLVVVAFRDQRIRPESA